MKTLAQFILNEELNKKQKARVDSWGGARPYIKNKLDKVFGEGNHKVVILYEPKTERIHSETIDELPTESYDIARHVEHHINKHGFTIHDYIGGYARKKEIANDDPKPRLIGIGSILAKSKTKEPLPDIYGRPMDQSFNTDKIRQGAKATKEIVISRHPHDVAGASTDRGWKSCGEMDDDGKCSKHAARKLQDEVQQGTITAYLVNKGDHGLKNPVARVHLKRYDGTKGDEIWQPDKRHYGTAQPDFREHVQKWADEKFPATKSTQYDRTPHVYQDDTNSSIIKDGVPQKYHSLAKAVLHGQTVGDGNDSIDANKAHEDFSDKLPSHRHISDEHKTIFADKFVGSTVHGSPEDQNNENHFKSNVTENDEFDNKDDDPEYYRLKFHHKDTHHLMAHAVASNPAAFMDHATDKPAFAKRLYDIHRWNKDVQHEEENTNDELHQDPGIHTFMVKHLPAKEKENLGEDGFHERFYQHSITNITDKDYLRGVQKWNAGRTDDYHSTDRIGTVHRHILKHGDMETVKAAIASPAHDHDDPEDVDLAHEAKQRFSKEHSEVLKTGDKETVMKALQSPVHDTSNPEHVTLAKAAFRRFGKENKKETNTQVFNPKWERTMQNLKEAKSLDQFIVEASQHLGPDHSL